MELPLPRVRQLRQLQDDPVSLEAPVGDGESHFSDLIEDVNADRPDARTAEKFREVELTRGPRRPERPDARGRRAALRAGRRQAAHARAGRRDASGSRASGSARSRPARCASSSWRSRACASTSGATTECSGSGSERRRFIRVRRQPRRERRADQPHPGRRPHAELLGRRCAAAPRDVHRARHGAADRPSSWTRPTSTAFQARVVRCRTQSDHAHEIAAEFVGGQVADHRRLQDEISRRVGREPVPPAPPMTA